MGAQTQHKARPQVGRPTHRKARPQFGHPNARPQRKHKASLQCKACLHVRNLGATTQRNARLQDGRSNAKLIRNENIHTREH
jgi:hypothetical protein